MKKLTSLILTLIMIFTFQGQSVFAYDREFDTASQFLSQLSITDNIVGDENGNITRAEFAAMIVRAMNMSSLTSDDESFEDVSKSQFKNEIYVAKALGITNGTSDVTFTPDGLVPYQVAAKMLVSALGYSSKAEALGGYPTGYQNVANSLKLYSGVQGSDNLSIRDAYILVRNMMTANVAVFDGIENGNLNVSVQKGKNILTENFGFGYNCGVISTANGRGINFETTDFNTIEIGGTFYKTKGDFSYLLGRSAEIWYDSDNFVKLIAPSVENNTVTIDAQQVSEVDNNVLVADDGNKERKYKLKSGFSFVFNGRSIAFDKSDFYFDHGTLTLVDNDGDGAYEYVIADKIEYFVISSMDSSSGKIYDTSSNLREISVESTSDYDVQINVDGMPASSDDLKKGMGCEVLMSEDGGICVINAFTKSVSGKVSEMWDNELRIDGIDYELSNYILRKNPTISPGYTYDFIITSDNVIIDFGKMANDAMQYGYLMGFRSGEGMQGVSQIKLLCSDGSKNIYDFRKKVMLDGVSLDFDDPAFASKLLDGGYPKYQVVRYKLTDGLISHIDTSDFMLTDWVVGEYESEEDSLTMYAQNLNVRYTTYATFAYPNVPFKSISNIFNVPAEIQTNPRAIYDDERFSTNGVAGISNNAAMVVDVYDYNRYYVPQAAVIYESKSGVDFCNPSQQTTIYMVRGVSDYITEDGETLKRMRLFSGSKYVQYFVEPKTAEIVEKMYRFPGPGDAIRISVNQRGYINGFAIDVTYNRDEHSIKIHYDGGGYPGSYHGIEKSAGSYMTYFGGRVIAATNGYMAITPDQTPPDNSGALGGVVNLSLGSGTYMVYDRHTNDVYSASFDDIVTAMDAGEENASLVACKSYYYNTNVVLIYKN